MASEERGITPSYPWTQGCVSPVQNIWEWMRAAVWGWHNTMEDVTSSQCLQVRDAEHPAVPGRALLGKNYSTPILTRPHWIKPSALGLVASNTSSPFFSQCLMSQRLGTSVRYCLQKEQVTTSFTPSPIAKPCSIHWMVFIFIIIITVIILLRGEREKNRNIIDKACR